MKKIFIFTTLFVSITLLSGCQKNINGVTRVQNANDKILSNSFSYKDANKMLKSLNTYGCSADITYISNKTQNTYKIVQYAHSDGRYRIEVVSPDNVSGNITTYDGKTIRQYNTKSISPIKVSTTDTSERSEIFLFSFINNYFSSDNISVNASNVLNESFITLEAKISGNHPYMASEKLWLDDKTLTPKKLVIYDYNNMERIIIIYNQYIFNPKLDDKIFIN